MSSAEVLFPVQLPKPLKNGEVYCHICGSFVLSVNSSQHNKWHRMRLAGVAPKPVINKVKDIKVTDVKVKDNDLLTHQKPLTSVMTSLSDLGDGPPCVNCGSIMVRNGTCYGCKDCGTTSGCS